MEVVVDGSIYSQQRVGGISRIFDEVLPLIPDLDPQVQIKVVTQTAPRNYGDRVSQITVPSAEKMLRPRKLWKRVYPTLDALLIASRIGPSRASVLHTTYYRSLRFWQGREVCSVYDLIYERYPSLLQAAPEMIRLKSDAFSRADHFLCISNTTKQDLMHYYHVSEERISISPLACGAQFRCLPSDQLESVANGPFILYVGRRSKYKGFSDLVLAYSRWALSTEVNLLAVGEQWNEDERKWLAQLGLQDRLVLVEHVDDGFLCQLYNQATAFVHPSLYEGFGIPLLEAMACGCPVIASDIPSTREVAGTAPLYFEAGAAESLLEVLNRCVVDHSHVDQQVRAGLERVKQFSWQRTAHAFLDAYRKLSGAPPRSRYA